jgi:hypothetical protein
VQVCDAVSRVFGDALVEVDGGVLARQRRHASKIVSRAFVACIAWRRTAALDVRRSRTTAWIGFIARV